jgi:ATP-binding cassette, subfamily C (CFTR/MRP), member 1
MNCDSHFGPRVDPSCRNLDFTLYFEDVVFGILPASAFLFLLPCALYLLYNKPKVIDRISLVLAKLVRLFTTPGKVL